MNIAFNLEILVIYELNTIKLAKSVLFSALGESLTKAGCVIGDSSRDVFVISSLYVVPMK